MARKEKRRIIGVDCHPDTFTAAIVVGTDAEDARSQKVSDGLAWSQLETWFSKHAEAVEVVALESSGNSFAVYDRLTALGLEVLVLDSEVVSRLGKELVDTDKTSAVRIARVFLSGLSEKVWVPDPLTRERRKVYACYSQARKDRTRYINRIKSMLNEHMVRLPKRANLRSEEVRKAVFSARNWTDTQHTLLEEAFRDLARADQKHSSTRRLMAQTVLSDPTMLSLVRIFGLKLITVYALVAMIGNVKRFRSPKQLAAYLGLSPGYKTSGSSVRKKQRCRNHGRADMRALLTQSGQSVLTCHSPSNPLYSWAWKLSFRKSRNHAVIAAARKIVVSVWYVLNGKALPLERAEQRMSLQWKLEDLAKHAGGASYVHRMGFKSRREYVEQKLLFFGKELDWAT